MSDTTSDPNRIERDLDQTRSRLGSHLNELQDRLSPGQVLDDLMGYFRGSEGAEFGRSLLDNVRGNPMPAALTAISLAWLMASSPRTGAEGSASGKAEGGTYRVSGPHLYGRDDYGATLARVRDAERSVVRDPDEADHIYSARLDDVRGQAVGLARHSQESAESFGERIRDALDAAERAVAATAHDVRDQVSGALSAVGNAIGSIGTSAQGAARHAGSALSQGSQTGGNLVAAITESPALLGALGLAAGTMLGALLPVSDQEEQALGDVAGQVRNRATGLAKDGIESGKHVAESVLDKARDSAQAHGLARGKTPGQLVDAALSGELAGNAKAVAGDVLRAGDEAIRQETSAPKGSSTPLSAR